MKELTVNRRLTDVNDSISAIGPEALIDQAFLVSKELTAYINHLKLPLKKLINRDSDADKNFYQRKLHGLAWYATYVEALKSISSWAYELNVGKKFGALERLILILGFNEYLHQLRGGILMSQNEFIRPDELDINKSFFKIFSSRKDLKKRRSFLAVT